MSFTAASNIEALILQSTDRTIGVPLSATDAMGCLLSVQFAVVNTTQAVWDRATWDSSIWDDPNYATWNDITSRVRGIEWDRGATDPITDPEVGTASITLDNRDGYVSPWATVGPFTNPTPGSPIWDQTLWDQKVAGTNASLVRPNVAVRFGVTMNDGNWYPFFTGLIETIEEDTEQNVDGWVTLGLVDFAAKLAAIGSGLTTGSVMNAGDPAGTMIANLLTDIAWPFTNFTGTTVSTSSYQDVLAMQIPDPSANRLAAAQLLATSAFAEVIAQSNGELLLLDRLYSAAVSSYTYSNSPGAGELPLIKVTPYSSTDRLLNSVTGTCVGGTTQNATDMGSISQFGLQANALGWPRSDLLLQNDSDVQSLVTTVVNSQSNDFLGISSVDLDADMDRVNLYGQLALIASQGLETNGQFNVRWVHPSTQVFSVRLRLLGFSHSLTMEGSQAKWTATFRTATV